MAEAKEKTMIEAFIELQKELPKLEKKANNPFFDSKYVPLEEVLVKVLPIINKHGFALTQRVDTQDGSPVLITNLWYSKDDFFVSYTLLMLKSEDPQAQGSAITYARRYALMAMLGLVGEEDDDGNKASAPQQNTLDRKATPAQVTALRNMVIGFSNHRVTKDSVDSAIMTLAEITDLNDLKFSKASELMNEIKRTKKVPLDFDESDRDFDREEDK